MPMARNRDDDFEPLMAQVLECNPVIFASPICWYSCAPAMKVFPDRVTDYLDVSELLESGRRLRGKDAYVACTSVRDEASEHDAVARKFVERMQLQVVR